MVISGTYACHKCGTQRDFGEAFPLPPAPFKIPCAKCGAALIESVPEDLMEVWAQHIESTLTDEEKALVHGDAQPE